MAKFLCCWKYDDLSLVVYKTLHGKLRILTMSPHVKLLKRIGREMVKKVHFSSAFQNVDVQSNIGLQFYFNGNSSEFHKVIWLT